MKINAKIFDAGENQVKSITKEPPKLRRFKMLVSSTVIPLRQGQAALPCLWHP